MLTHHKSQSRWLSVTIALLAVCGVSNATNSTIAVTNDGGAAPSDHTNYDDAGWQFTNASPITITALGLFANGGLTASHQVSIYNQSGALQVSAVVPTGLTPDAQGYVYIPLGSPFTLPPGTWIIAGSYAVRSPDFVRVGNSGSAASVVMSAPLTFGGAHIWFNASAPVDPNNPGPGNTSFASATAAAYFGPNFQFTLPVTPIVPAPTSALLLLIGFGFLAIWRWQNRRAKVVVSN